MSGCNGAVASRAPRASFRSGPRPNVMRDMAPAPAPPPPLPETPAHHDGPEASADPSADPSDEVSDDGPRSSSSGGTAVPSDAASLPPADPVAALASASAGHDAPTTTSEHHLESDSGSDSDSDDESFHLPSALIPPLPVSVLLFRKPLPTSEGTDPYHDAFGSFCLPSFPSSALESGSSTPLPPPVNPNALQGPTDRSGAERLRNALQLSSGGQRRGRWINDEPMLTTHHLTSKDPHEIALARRVADAALTRLVKPNKKVNPEAQAAANAALEIDQAVEWCVTSIPVLETGLVNLDRLADRLIEGAEVPLPPGTDSSAAEATANLRYRGVIITSQRSIEAYVKAAEMAADRLVGEAIARGAKTTLPPFTAWNRIPFFLIGPATEKQLRNVAIKIPTPFRPRTILGGPTTTNADALAKYIIRHFADTPTKGKALSYDVKVKGNPPPGSNNPKDWLSPQPGIARSEDEDPLIEPLLMLTGDKNLHTLRDILGSVGQHPHQSPQAQAAQAQTGRVHPTKEVWQLAPIPTEELMVYETHEDPALDEHLNSLVTQLPGAEVRSPSFGPTASEGNGPPFDPLTGAARPAGPAGPSETHSSRALSQPMLEPVSSLIPQRKTDESGESAVSSGSTSPVLGRRPSLKATRLAERLHAIHAAQRSHADFRPRTNGARSGSLPPGALRPTGLTPLVPDSPSSHATPDEAEQRARDRAARDAARDALREARWDSSALEMEIHERQWAAAGKLGAVAQPDWIVFFSPSGVQYSLPHLRRRGWLPPRVPDGPPPSIQDPPGMGSGRPKIAALGGTTKRWIRDHLKFWPDATAAMPTPNELFNAIAAVQRRVRTQALRQAAEEAQIDPDSGVATQQPK